MDTRTLAWLGAGFWLLLSGCAGTVGGAAVDSGVVGDGQDTGADPGDPGGADPGADRGADPGSDPGADHGPSCPEGQHLCGGICVEDDSVDHCGDRCEPCPSVDHGTSTCDGNVCGFTCDDGFLLCLGACIPEDEGPCGVNLPSNTWVKLSQGDIGPRTSATMVYLDDTEEYVLVGGSMPISAVPRPYDVQSLRLAEMVWKNRYPHDKIGLWGPDVGDCQAPGFGTEHFVTQDEEGNPRPNWSAYPTIHTYHQAAYNPQTNSLLFYLYNRTFAYDVVARSWTFPEPSADPAGGAGNPRLLWGAMAFDPVDDEALLIGGGNVKNDPGRPGTWMYEAGTSTWRQVEGGDPGPRAVTAVATDPDRRKALLFGGDELDHLKADTWVFDFATESWSQLHPSIGPSPRGGHHLFFLPTSRTVVALGGFGYTSTTDYVASHYATLPWEIWRFDWDTPAWELIKRFDPGEEQPAMSAMRNVTWAAAAGVGDVVVIHVKKGYAGEMEDSETWAIRIDASVVDPAGTAAHGVAPGTETWRSGPYDPAWYETGWPDPDPGAFAQLLAEVPANTWTEIDVPNRPAHNHDWGTVAHDPVRHRLYRWSGGHSAHCGTDVLEYDMLNNRFHMYYAPEFPLEFEYTNGQVPGQWSFEGRPFMTGHTYKTYAYAEAVGKMVIWKNPVVYTYDPDAHAFDLQRGETDGGGNMYTTVLCPVPDGMVAWTPDGLWQLDAAARTWQALPVEGDTLPQLAPDKNILVHDATRNRFLLFASTGDNLGQVIDYDRTTHQASALSPGGQTFLHDNGPGFCREAVYVPAHDAVVIGASFDDGQGVMRTPVYHADENQWYAYAFAGQAAQEEAYGVSLGLVIDADERIWAINSRSHMFLLKLDPATADRLEI